VIFVMGEKCDVRDDKWSSRELFVTSTGQGYARLPYSFKT